MKELYTFKAQAEDAVKRLGISYKVSSCNVNLLDSGADDNAERILQTAMGEILCFRSEDTGEILAAWWEAEE